MTRGKGKAYTLAAASAEHASNGDDESVPMLGNATSKHSNGTGHYGDGSQLVEVWGDDETEDSGFKFRFSFKKLWSFTGPGWLMSIAYLDPGNIESDLQAGYVGGYNLLWVLLWATIFGIFMQLLAMRLGVVADVHLAELCRSRYRRAPRWVLWIMTEVAIIGSDIQEVLGSAIAIRILSGGVIKLWMGALITAVDTFTFLLLEKFGLRKLEAIFALLILTMAVTFGIEYGQGQPNQMDVFLGTVVPAGPPRQGHDTQFVVQAVGMIGAVIMPHNIYLHSALVQSRSINRSNSKHVKEAVIYNSIESAVALLVSFIINLFVVGVFAKSRDYFTLYMHDGDGIGCRTSNQQLYNTTDAIPGLTDGGCYLQHQFGRTLPAAIYIWAIGVLAAGQSSTMTGTYAGQFVMQGFLDLKISAWKRILITRLVAIVPAVIVGAVFQAQVDTMGTWLNVLQNIQLPFAIIPIIIFTSDRKLMGEFKNNLVVIILVSIFAVAIIGINVYLVVQQVGDSLAGSDATTTGLVWGGVSIAFAIYLAYICYITWFGLRTVRADTDYEVKAMVQKRDNQLRKHDSTRVSLTHNIKK